MNSIKAKLISLDGYDELLPSATQCNFGSAVAVSGNTIVVGSRNRSFGVAGNCANVFVRQPTTRQWKRQALLLPNICQHVETCQGVGGFGYSVGINKDTIIVGTAATLPGPFAYCGSRGGDATYIFERTPATGIWRQTATLHPKGIWTTFLATRQQAKIPKLDRYYFSSQLPLTFSG